MRYIFIFLLFLLLPARADTVFNFAGSPFVLNRSPAELGTNITGSVTFHFETVGVTGIFPAYGASSDVQFSFGNYVAPDAGVYDGYFILTDGNITDWLVRTKANCPQLGCDVVLTSSPYSFPDHQWDFLEQHVFQVRDGSGPLPLYAYTAGPGLWTAVVPQAHSPAPVPSLWWGLGFGLIYFARWFRYRMRSR